MKLKKKQTVHPAQYRFLTSEVLFRLFVGGRGAGKTYSGASAALKEAGKRKCWGMVVAPTYKDLQDYSVREFISQGGGVISRFIQKPPTAHMINGSVVNFRSAEDPESLRGPDISWIWLDEPRNMQEMVWKICLPCLREGGRAGRMWLTTTPDGKSSSWIYDRFVTRKNKNYESFKASSQDNPYVSRELLKAIEEDYGFGSWGKQELGGEWVDPEGALFRRQDLKIVDFCPEDINWVRSWDLATSTKETACCTAGSKVGMDSEGNFYIADMIMGKWEWPDAREVIIQTALMDGISVPVLIEKVAFQTAAIQEMQREESLYNHLIYESVPDKDKFTRSLPVASRARAGKVFLQRAAWNSTLIDELTSFTGGKNETNDQADAIAQGYQWLAENTSDMTVMKI